MLIAFVCLFYRLLVATRLQCCHCLHHHVSTTSFYIKQLVYILLSLLSPFRELQAEICPRRFKVAAWRPPYDRWHERMNWSSDFPPHTAQKASKRGGKEVGQQCSLILAHAQSILLTSPSSAAISYTLPVREKDLSPSSGDAALVARN